MFKLHRFIRKEALGLPLKLSSCKTVTHKNNIDSTACTNGQHPLGEQQSGLSYDLLVYFIQEPNTSDMHPSALWKVQKEQHSCFLLWLPIEHWVGSIFVFNWWPGFWLQNILEISSSGMKDVKVWRVERTAIQRRVSLEVSPKLEDQPCPFQKGQKYIHLKRQKIRSTNKQNLTRQELVTT